MMRDFALIINKKILENLSVYWKNGYILMSCDDFPFVNHISDIVDIAYESLLWNAPYEVDLVFDNEYKVKVSAKNWRPPQTGWFLYKYYVDDELMYIGRTVDPVRRLFEHIQEDSKFRAVNRFDIYECKSKSDMLFLERLLIGQYSPPWNVVDADNGGLSFDIPEIDFTSYNIMEFVSRY